MLDLYAGSGALGLEAASRGAATVTLVERATDAARVCKENAARVMRNAPKGGRERVAIKVQSVASFLESSTAIWDLVFLDPPYDIIDDDLTHALAALVPRLAPGAVILLERATASRQPSWPAGVTCDRSRKYGDTTLWWAHAD